MTLSLIVVGEVVLRKQRVALPVQSETYYLLVELKNIIVEKRSPSMLPLMIFFINSTHTSKAIQDQVTHSSSLSFRYLQNVSDIP